MPLQPLYILKGYEDWQKGLELWFILSSSLFPPSFRVTTFIHLFRYSKLIQNRNKVLFTELIFEQNIGCTIYSLWEYLWFEMWSDNLVLALVALHWRSSAYHFSLFSGLNSTTVGGGKIPLRPRNCFLVNFKLHNRCWTFLDSSRVEALSCQYWKDSQDVV